MREIAIASKVINEDSHAFTIAEIGHNHQGNLKTCKEMFQVAAECGVDAVKLQKRDNKNLYTQEFYNSPYTSENSFGKTYGEHREKLEFDFDSYKELQNYAEDLGIIFFATAFDTKSVDFLASLKMPAIKIASGDLKSIPLLRYAARTNIPLIISTGGATLDEVKFAYNILKKESKSNFSFLQCTAAYPADESLLNLKVIQTYLEEFPDVVIGFSSHDKGTSMSLPAYALGARIIEKHFTLDRTMKGTDHAFSLEPNGLKRLVRDLINTKKALGVSEKKPHDSEVAPIRKMSKKGVYVRHVRVNEILLPEMVEMKSPGDGVSFIEIESLLGRKLKRNRNAGEDLSFEDF
jgi:sialic acid synthase